MTELFWTAVGYALEGTSIESVSRGWVYLSLALAYNLVLTGLTGRSVTWFSSGRAANYFFALAGRIIYITRWNCHLLSQALRRRYITTIAVLYVPRLAETRPVLTDAPIRVESGVLYTIYLGLNLAFQRHPVANVCHTHPEIRRNPKIDIERTDRLRLRRCPSCGRPSPVAVFIPRAQLTDSIIQGIVPTLIMVQVGLGRTVAHGNNNEEAVVRLMTTQQPYPEDPSTLLTQHRPSTSMSGLSTPPPMRPRANS